MHSDTAGAQQTFELAIASLHPAARWGAIPLGGFEDPAHPGAISFMNTTMIGIIEGDSVPDKFIPWLIEQNVGTLPMIDDDLPSQKSPLPLRILLPER
jgi:hypothetical protein